MTKEPKKTSRSKFEQPPTKVCALSSITAVALKQMIAVQISEEMTAQNLTKTELAKRMHTSRSALDRLLDAQDPSLTLATLSSAATALGKKVNLNLC
jgi:antitoxin HicB